MKKILEKHNDTLKQNSVKNLLPSLLKKLKEPEIHAALIQKDLPQFFENPEGLQTLGDEIDEKFITLLKENNGLQALFNDTDFHTLIQDKDAIAELARLIKADWLEF